MLAVYVVVIVVTLTSIYIGHHNGSNSWLPLKTTVWTAAPVLVAYVVWTKLLKGSRPESYPESSESSTGCSEHGQEPTAELERATRECVDCSTQTDGRDFLVDAKRLERSHQREMRRLTRQTHYFKRHMQAKLKESSDHIKEKAKQLSIEQTELLPLVSRKKALLDEQQILQELLLEEEKRQREMAARFDQLTRNVQSLRTEITGTNHDSSLTYLDGTSHNLGNGDGPKTYRCDHVPCYNGSSANTCKMEK